MKLNRIFAVVFIVAFAVQTQAQLNVLNAQKPEDIGKPTQEQIDSDNSKPLPYPYVDKRDVLYQKNIWEYVDLDERLNFPLLFPTDSMNIGSDRRSLFDTLIANIRNGNITEVYADSYFTEKKKPEDIESSLVLIDTTDAGKDQFNTEGFVDDEYITRYEVDSRKIVAYKIRGLWYFDARQGEMKYRLLGICPVAPDPQTMNQDFAGDENTDVELFWVWFLDAREVLHKAMSFNPENQAKPISFDHLLNARRFSAVIYKAENEYGDREIPEYVRDNALFQLLESDRLKEQIRNFDEDQWQY